MSATPNMTLEGFLASIVESSNDAIVSKTLDGTVTSWNRAAERIFGYSDDEMIGHPITKLLVPGQSDDILLILEKISQGQRVEHYETLRRTKDGRTINVSLSVSPIRDATGKIIGAAKIARDITERKRIEDQNAALLKEIRQSAKHKDEFLSMLAHELRNPLAPLRNAVYLLHLRGDDPTVVDRVREMMDRQITHLGRLIDDLVDISRITRGTIKLNPERTDLARLARITTEDQHEIFQNSGIAFETRIPEIPVWVHGDHTRLTQVLENLLENARKFTQSGRIEIEVAADLTRQEAVMRVRDTGIGVDPELLPRLFEPFTQADRTLDRRSGGLGLGLALVKRLVELHDGTVSAQSAGTEQGAEFTIRLPLQDEPMALSESLPSQASLTRHVRVLVVEDNRDSAESLRMLLSTQGYEVALAYTGTEGVEAARSVRPDVVICDVGLPGMDGYEVARAIRMNPGTAKTRLIAVTGYGRDDDRVRALASGFDNHLVKPADPEALLGLLN
jgi:PAS domain S-box-containing protein